ncbi:MAG: transglutaminase domain-containing protein, partial [Actinobacteria bacterium]|nr:transglutaminase domain-containing protein [Actinomycetota bacterium]
LWLRLEHPRGDGDRALLVVALALVPGLLPRVWQRAAAALAASVAAAWVALAASPFDASHDDFGPLLARLRDGTLEFYDVSVPFDPGAHPLMHGALLIGVFGFCLALGLALASRRPLAAAAIVVAAGGWPATLLPGDSPLLLGAALLVAVLWPLAGLRAPSLRRLAPAAAAGSVLALAATAAATSGALARDGALRWQAWDLYDRAATPVGVAYVWDASYTGIRFPERKTVVLRIRGPKQAHYWRATTLDVFTSDRWIEGLVPLRVGVATNGLTPDPLLPARASDSSAWVEQEIEVVSLRDDHLVAATQPLVFEAAALGTVFELTGGVVRAQRRPRQGQGYTVWSYAPTPKPAALARVRPAYPDAALRYLDVGRTRLLPFGAGGREREIEALFQDDRYRALWPYEGLYRTALQLAAGAETPYAAVVAIETWLRSTGGFAYDELPPEPAAGVPPLADFVGRSKRGYCQQFAGSMALMLRFLGIPARVAAGFTSGTFKDGAWVVTDHNAHAWVEAWFPGYGWLTFDPTPARGTLTSPYSTASDSADAFRAIATAAGFAGNRALDPGGGTLDRLLRERSRGRVAGGDGGGRGPGLVVLAVFLLGGAGAALGLTKLAARRLRYLTRDPRRLAGAARRELAGFLADQRLPVSDSATLGDLRALVEAELGVSAKGFAAAAGAARFGPPGGAAPFARLARRELRALLRVVRARLSRVERVRGFLCLRSLGLRA